MDVDLGFTPCPMCGETSEPLGVLGRRVHYHCRYCGWLYSELAQPQPAPETV